MEIITASAGSGKTYTLAQKYIDILLSEYLARDSKTEFEHILAVTFTNKATAEMKDRILKELHILATNPSASDYFSYFQGKYPSAKIADKYMWQSILLQLLNNYSHFAVSTIDTFFQSVLRSFARELNNYRNYRIEIDRDAVIEEAADNLLVSITQSDPLYTYLSRLSESSLEEGKKTQGTSIVDAAAANILKGAFKSALRKYKMESTFMDEVRNGGDAYLKKLEALEKDAKVKTKSLVELAKTKAKELLDDVDSFPAKDLSGRSSARQQLEAFVKSGVIKFTDAFWPNLKEGTLFKASTTSLEQFTAMYSAQVLDFEKDVKDIKMYDTIMQSLPELFLAIRLFVEFDKVMDENNIKCLDETTEILANIIAGSDAPFIYEKIGVMFKHFLLDEFQDTSYIQWENFLPLLKNAEAELGKNLVVGDIKQSIYRFRNSEADILAKEVPSKFPRATSRPLDTNFRSAELIVDFNNKLFPRLAKRLDEELKNYKCISPNDSPIADMYRSKADADNLGQQVGKKNYKGYIESFNLKKDDTQAVVDYTFYTVKRLLEYEGIKASDILILVRGKDEAGTIAEALLSEGIGVSCDESLRIDSNAHARQLLAVLRYMDNPKDTVAGHLVDDLGFDVKCHYPNLVTLCEKIIDAIKVKTPQDAFQGSVAYISALVDLVRDYENNYGNSLHSFLEYYSRKKRLIVSTPSEDAVQIMTIHKSKGLAGNFVIVPFTHKITAYDNDIKKCSNWAQLDEDKFSEGDYHDFIYYTALKDDNEAFSEAYHEEKYRSYVDGINLFYVALTRAKFGLYMIGYSKEPDKGKPCAQNMAYMMKEVLTDSYNELGSDDKFSQILCLGDEGDAVKSCIQDKNNEEQKRQADNAREKTLICEYMVNLSTTGYIRNSNEANDFFANTVSGEAAEHNSARIKGIVMHDILSLINTEDDIEKAVGEKYNEGVLETSVQDTVEFFRAKLDSVKSFGWFEPDLEIFSERDILVKIPDEQQNGKMMIVSKRPDRIVVHPDGSVSIVDYKFTGESGANLPHYRKQVEAYCDYYRALPGNDSKTVRGYIWYVNSGEVFAV